MVKRAKDVEEGHGDVPDSTNQMNAGRNRNPRKQSTAPISVMPLRVDIPDVRGRSSEMDQPLMGILTRRC